ncbi:hypothetical protein CVT26_006594 [Gymnopilus dilepis]|uniref:Uncharacterized protein n=1 Tax=Gymnopilus dilepis TaxID=231916 RepID=A0A409Y2Y2_9AGAR|nr:hypothetical protein CVT26_006594 [Gymnopilus dilepis]
MPSCTYGPHSAANCSLEMHQWPPTGPNGSFLVVFSSLLASFSLLFRLRDRKLTIPLLSNPPSVGFSWISRRHPVSYTFTGSTSLPFFFLNHLILVCLVDRGCSPF